MFFKYAALKVLALLSLLCFIAACSLAPKPLCSRIESTDVDNNCPAPAPPLTRRVELSEEELAAQPDKDLTKAAALSPEQRVRRQQILARIKDLKEGSDYQPDKTSSEVIEPISEPETYFTIQLGAFKLVEGQQKTAEKIEQGPVYTYELSNGLLAISTGKLTDFDEAKEMASKYRNSGFNGAYAIKLPVNALNIRDE
jgi:hypothetical protein